MGQISDIRNPWRDLLVSTPASFRGVIFHVETGARNSGRRTVTHEYPKRDLPYAEDMGRHARRFNLTGYLIYRPSNPLYQYTTQRMRLFNALEQNDAGALIHPVFAAGGMLVMCERYSMTESRERGGYTTFEMTFVEAGQPGNSQTAVDTNGNVASSAAAVENNARDTFAQAARSQAEAAAQKGEGVWPA